MQKSPPLNEEGHTYVLMLSRASLGSLLEPCLQPWLRYRRPVNGRPVHTDFYRFFLPIQTKR